MYKVLMVEDDSQIRDVVGDYFTRHGGIELDFADDGNYGMDRFLNGEYDLVLLDVMMPGLNGFELCKLIRKTSNIPVIFLTGKVREEDMLYGYGLGCDDYIVKPFLISVLYKKVMAFLERTKEDKPVNIILTNGSIEMNTSNLEVRVNSQPVDLPPKEFAILKYFLEHVGMAVSRKVLLSVGWPGDDYVSERVVDNRVNNLRKSLGNDGKKIRTLIGVGYIMDKA